MARPKIGYKNAAGKRVPGVTTVIGPYGDSGGLIHWAWDLGMKGINYRDVRDNAANVGTMAHELVECHIRKQPREEWPSTWPGASDDDVKRAWNAFASYRRWEEQTRTTIQYSEIPIVSEELQVGGCPDAVGTEEGVGPVLLDWKCLLPGVLFRRADGSTVRADEVLPGDMLTAWDGEAFVPDEVSEVRPGGVQPCVRVVTNYGRVLEVSANHPVLSAGEWIQAGKLKKGDPVKPCVEFGSGDLEAGTARLLGYLVADGCFAGSKRGLANSDPGVVADFMEEANALKFIVREEKPHPGRSFYMGGSGSFLRDHGLLGCGAADKRVPDAVMAAGEDSVCAFLGAAISCDGYVSKVSIGRPDLHYYTTSERLAQEMTDLLRRVGINASCWRDSGKMHKGAPYKHWFVRSSSKSAMLVAADRLLPHIRCERTASRIRDWAEKLGEPVSDWRKRPRVAAEESVASVEALLDLPTIAVTMRRYETFVTSGIVTHNTGNKVYPETLYQLAGYVLLWEEAHPDDPPLVGIHLLRFGKDYGDFHHHAWPVDCPPVQNAMAGFKHLCALYDLHKIVKKGI